MKIVGKRCGQYPFEFLWNLLLCRVFSAMMMLVCEFSSDATSLRKILGRCEKHVRMPFTQPQGGANVQGLPGPPPGCARVQIVFTALPSIGNPGSQFGGNRCFYHVSP